MENKKLVTILIVLVVIFGLGFVGLTLYLLGMKKGQSVMAPGTNEVGGPSSVGLPSAVQNGGAEQGPMYIAEKSKQPEIMTGKIGSIDGEKLVLKQIASIDLSYEIKKEDVSSVVIMEKNPLFDEEKAKKAQEETMRLLPPVNPTPDPTEVKNDTKENPVQPELSEEAKKKLKEFQADEALRMYNEKKSSWEDLNEGMQINLVTENDRRRITVFPEDFPTGPTETSPPVSN